MENHPSHHVPFARSVRTPTLLAALILGGSISLAGPLGTAFSYQGRLTDGGNPANGSYVLTFTLFDAVTDGTQIGSALTNSPVGVTNGLFTTTLDFGASVFTGDARWLELAVCTNGPGSAGFTLLSPRQPLTPSPYALYAPSAGAADTAVSAGIANAVAAANISGTLALTQLPGVLLTNGQTRVSLTGKFTGDGTTLANVNADLLDNQHATAFAASSHQHSAAEVTSGTLADVRLSPNVALLSSNSTFSGTVTFNPSGGGAPFAVGSAALVTNLNADRLDGLEAASFWKLSGNSGTTPPTNFLGTTDNNPLELWVNNGRAFRLEPTTNGPNVIGGYADNAVASGTRSATIVGGGGVRSNYDPIDHQWFTEYGPLAVSGSFSAIGGGFANQIRDAAWYAAIGGGENNIISTNASWSAIGGGAASTIETNAHFSTIGGGWVNTIQANADQSVIGGGYHNLVQTNADYATVPGGYYNTSAGNYSCAAGRQAKANHQGSFVWADSQGTDFASSTNDEFAVRAGGGVRFVTSGAGLTVDGVKFSGTNLSVQLVADSVYSTNIADGEVKTADLADGAVTSAKIASGTIAGTNVNAATFDTVFWKVNGNAGTVPGVHFLGTTDAKALYFKVNDAVALRLVPNDVCPSVIAGSSANVIASGMFGGTISGGSVNQILSGADYGAIAGGVSNVIQPLALAATVGGGSLNIVFPSYATVGGGEGNFIYPDAEHATICGVQANSILTNAPYATIGGGYANMIAPNAKYSTIPGGDENTASGDWAFAAGRQANAAHQGSFVWADSQPAAFSSTANDQVSFRCFGGVRFTSGIAGGIQTVSWTPGAGAWNFASDRSLKEGFTTVDTQAVLNRVSRLPISEWNYRGFAQRHIGPTAQDFHAQFPLNESDTMLNDADLHGVTLAAIQGLNQKLEEKNAELKELKQTVADLRALVDTLVQKSDGGGQ